MNALVKNLLAGFAVGSLALAGAVTAGDDNDHLKHKVIEIKADSSSDVNIVISGDENETITLTFDELQDEAILESKLAHLDDKMRDTVMSALSGMKNIKAFDFDGNSLLHEGEKKVFVMHKGEGDVAFAHGSGDVDFDFEIDAGDGKVVKKHWVIGKGSEVLKGHTDAIVRLIERGEFSQEELDKIQAAVDAKR